MLVRSACSAEHRFPTWSGAAEVLHDATSTAVTFRLDYPGDDSHVRAVSLAAAPPTTTTPFAPGLDTALESMTYRPGGYFSANCLDRLAQPVQRV